MKLLTISRTGLSPVRALKDSGSHLKGAVFGLPPAIAAKAIEAKDVEPAPPEDGAETVEVEVAADGTSAPAADEKGASDANSTGTQADPQTSAPAVDPQKQAPATLKQPAKGAA